ncbi:MAG: four helix bundle protein [Alphaproteobacteria bacterium]|nr:four helix bundle protein [Alphaproteobacteria bacterium]
MPNSEGLPIYIDTYHLAQDVFADTVSFPRDYKFILGTRLNNDVLDLCCLIDRINRADDKDDLLDMFISGLERVRIQLRLCADFKLIGFQRQAGLAEMIEKIWTQAVAWQKSERRRQKSVPESG